MERIMRSLFRLTCVATFILSATFSIRAQDDASKDKNKLEFFLREDRRVIELSFPKSPPPEFIRLYSELASTYRLYEVESPDPEKECTYQKCILEWTDFLKAGAQPECSNNTDCPRVVLQLSKELPTGKNFVLVVSGLKAGKLTKVPLSVEPKAEIVSALNAYQQRNGFRIQAKFPLQSADTVTVARTVYKITGSTPETLRAEEVKQEFKAALDKEISTGENGTLSYRLTKNLREGAEYNLSIKDGVTDSEQRPVEVKGTL